VKREKVVSSAKMRDKLKNIKKIKENRLPPIKDSGGGGRRILF